MTKSAKGSRKPDKARVIKAQARPHTIPDKEIQTFAKKLKNWGDKLPDNQRAILAMIMLRADRTRIRKSQGIAVSSFSEITQSLMNQFAGGGGTYLRERDGGTPDGGWVSWAAKLE